MNTKITETIVQAQEVLHTLQWELEKARDKESRKQIIQMIDFLVELYKKYENNKPESQ